MKPSVALTLFIGFNLTLSAFNTYVTYRDWETLSIGLQVFPFLIWPVLFIWVLHGIKRIKQYRLKNE